MSLIIGNVERLTRDRQETILIRLKGRIQPIQIPLLLRPKQGEVRYSPETILFSSTVTDEQATRVVLQSRTADFLSGVTVNGAPDWLEIETRPVGRNLVILSLRIRGTNPPGEHAIECRKGNEVIATISLSVK